MAEDLDYVRTVFFEAMRLEPPVELSLAQSFSHDITIGELPGYKQSTGLDPVRIKADEMFFICFRLLHHDKFQWKKPLEFRPERFDPKSEWYKRPDGGPRHPLAFCPFSGGKRVCIGKTFAEITVKFTIPVLYHYFDF